jgi:hypothetical protein
MMMHTVMIMHNIIQMNKRLIILRLRAPSLWAMAHSIVNLIILGLQTPAWSSTGPSAKIKVRKLIVWTTDPISRKRRGVRASSQPKGVWALM